MKVLIPAAGKGSRFQHSKYRAPKPCITVDNEFMLVRAAKTLGLNAEFIFILRENAYRNELANKLYETFPRCKVGVIDFDTFGSAETALIAESFLDQDELLIANCDQIMNWNVEAALKQLRKFDAGLVTIQSNDPKHSYAKVENNLVVEVQEKNVISDYALTGIHYWKHGSDFVRSARMMMTKENKTNGEFYIGPVYNEFIAEGNKVGYYNLDKNNIHFIGTPEDLEAYENRENK